MTLNYFPWGNFESIAHFFAKSCTETAIKQKYCTSSCMAEVITDCQTAFTLCILLWRRAPLHRSENAVRIIRVRTGRVKIGLSWNVLLKMECRRTLSATKINVFRSIFILLYHSFSNGGTGPPGGDTSGGERV